MAKITIVLMIYRNRALFAVQRIMLNRYSPINFELTNRAMNLIFLKKKKINMYEKILIKLWLYDHTANTILEEKAVKLNYNQKVCNMIFPLFQSDKISRVPN